MNKSSYHITDEVSENRKNRIKKEFYLSAWKLIYGI